MTSSSLAADYRRYYPMFFCILILFIHFIDYGAYSQGTGVIVRPETDHCSGAQGPRPITNQRSPGNTLDATIDDSVNGGYCGVEINTPGIWWWVNGTGQVIRASSCDEGTRIKVKMSVFTGSCNNLRCVAGGSRPDYECSVVTPGELGEWGTISTAVDFPTFKGQAYYILVQQMSLTESGAVWMRFREPNKPRNADCINSIGPVPHNGFPIIGTTEDSELSELPDYCIAESHYPGVWYQIIGTGGTVRVSACAQNNIDGFYFSVYHGGFCDSMVCVPGEYTVLIEDPEKCTFEGMLSYKTAFEFQTRDGDRYFIYVHYALTSQSRPTSPFFLFVDDDSGTSTYPSDDFIKNPNFSNKTQQQEQFSVFGTPSWDRFDAKWSLKVNDQCLYEFIFQFQHDTTLPIGDQNFQGNCAFQDPSTGLPFVADDGMLYHEPRQHWEIFPDYVWATIGFNHLSVDWLPCGHRPRGFSAPQYDFSFYRTTPGYRANTMQCMVRDEDGDDTIPGENVCSFEQETPEGMKFYILPASLVNRNPVVNMPSNFRRPEDGNNAFPHVGLRSWDQDIVPEFPNQWTDISLYMSSYDGDIAMWQTQIPYNLVSGSANKFTGGAAQYFEYTIPTFPDTYAFDYDDGIIRYIALGKSNVCKEDFEAAKAAFFASIPTTDSPSISPTQPPSNVASSPVAIPTSSNATTTLAPSTNTTSNETLSPSDQMEGGDPPPVNNDGLPIVAWLGIALGSLVGLCCCCALIVALYMNRKDSDEDEEEKEDINNDMNEMDSFDEDPMYDEDEDDGDDYDESDGSDDDDDDDGDSEDGDSEEDEDSSEEEDDTDDSNDANVV